MGSIARRLERLEAASKGPPHKGSAVYLDVYFKELENLRRLEAGEELVPFTEAEQAIRKETERWFYDEYLPAQREKANHSEHTRALLEQLEAPARITERSP